MSNRKIILYPKSAMKPIILTDSSNDSIEKLQENIINVLKDTKISILNTGSDSLIIRPSEIQAVLITTKHDVEEGHTDSHPTKYSKTLGGGHGSTN